MKKKKLTIAMLALSLIILGCESTGPKTKSGALAGGVIGATAGGVIGHQMGRGIEGAAIGAGLGAISGGLIGNQLDKQAQEIDRQALATNPNHLTLTAIVDMAGRGMPDSAIIDEINRTHSVYHLDSATIGYLKQNRVSDRVIDYMLSTAR